MDIILYFYHLFQEWLNTLFIIPFKNFDMLWLLVPVWLAWFFAEFFQEKLGTSLGNAISNAVVILWGVIDCTRKTVNLIVEQALISTGEIIARFVLLGMLFIYGLLIIKYGIKAHKIVGKIGRIRVVTYLFAMFVPVFYNAIPFSLDHFLATLIFFPLFYFTIELIDRIVPDPKAIQEDRRVEHPVQNPQHSPLQPIHQHTQHLMHQQESHATQHYQHMNQYPTQVHQVYPMQGSMYHRRY